MSNRKRNPRRYPTLLAWRMAHGLSQRQAATKLGLSQAVYCRFELGQRHARMPLLGRLMRETGVPLEVLTGIAS